MYSHSQSLAKIDAQLEQIADILKRGEEELPSRPMVDPKGHYMVDENTSYHEQAITTLKSEEVVKNHLEEMKEEKIEAP